MPTLLRLLPFAFLLACATALGHEFWLEAPRFRLQPGQTLNVHAFVGENFRGDPWTNKAAKILRFGRYGPTPADSTDLTPAPGLAATDTFRTAIAFAQPGTHVVLLRSTNSFIELPAAEFTAYLRAEGLDYWLQLRQERGQQATAGRETYRRCAKALLQVGEAPTAPTASDSACLRTYGLPLELVPEQNPYGLAAGRALTVRVVRAGRPVAGALVRVWQRQPAGLPATYFTTRANHSGRILLRLSGPGPYLLATVGMSEAPARLRDRTDWESTWASLTFAGPAGPIRRANPKR